MPSDKIENYTWLEYDKNQTDELVDLSLFREAEHTDLDKDNKIIYIYLKDIIYKIVSCFDSFHDRWNKGKTSTAETGTGTSYGINNFLEFIDEMLKDVEDNIGEYLTDKLKKKKKDINEIQSFIQKIKETLILHVDESKQWWRSKDMLHEELKKILSTEKTIYQHGFNSSTQLLNVAVSTVGYVRFNELLENIEFDSNEILFNPIDYITNSINQKNNIYDYSSGFDNNTECGGYLLMKLYNDDKMTLYVFKFTYEEVEGKWIRKDIIKKNTQIKLNNKWKTKYKINYDEPLDAWKKTIWARIGLSNLLYYIIKNVSFKTNPIDKTAEDGLREFIGDLYEDEIYNLYKNQLFPRISDIKQDDISIIETNFLKNRILKNKTITEEEIFIKNASSFFDSSSSNIYTYKYILEYVKIIKKKYNFDDNPNLKKQIDDIEAKILNITFYTSPVILLSHISKIPSNITHPKRTQFKQTGGSKLRLSRDELLKSNTELFHNNLIDKFSVENVIPKGDIKLGRVESDESELQYMLIGDIPKNKTAARMRLVIHGKEHFYIVEWNDIKQGPSKGYLHTYYNELNNEPGETIKLLDIVEVFEEFTVNSVIIWGKPKYYRINHNEFNITHPYFNVKNIKKFINKIYVENTIKVEDFPHKPKKQGDPPWTIKIDPITDRIIDKKLLQSIKRAGDMSQAIIYNIFSIDIALNSVAQLFINVPTSTCNTKFSIFKDNKLYDFNPNINDEINTLKPIVIQYNSKEYIKEDDNNIKEEINEVIKQSYNHILISSMFIDPPDITIFVEYSETIKNIMKIYENYKIEFLKYKKVEVWNAMTANDSECMFEKEIKEIILFLQKKLNKHEKKDNITVVYKSTYKIEYKEYTVTDEETKSLYLIHEEEHESIKNAFIYELSEFDKLIKGKLEKLYKEVKDDFISGTKEKKHIQNFYNILSSDKLKLEFISKYNNFSEPNLLEELTNIPYINNFIESESSIQEYKYNIICELFNLEKNEDEDKENEDKEDEDKEDGKKGTDEIYLNTLKNFSNFIYNVSPKNLQFDNEAKPSNINEATESDESYDGDIFLEHYWIEYFTKCVLNKNVDTDFTDAVEKYQESYKDLQRAYKITKTKWPLSEEDVYPALKSQVDDVKKKGAEVVKQTNLKNVEILSPFLDDKDETFHKFTGKPDKDWIRDIYYATQKKKVLMEISQVATHRAPQSDKGEHFKSSSIVNQLNSLTHPLIDNMYIATYKTYKLNINYKDFMFSKYIIKEIKKELPEDEQFKQPNIFNNMFLLFLIIFFRSKNKFLIPYGITQRNVNQTSNIIHPKDEYIIQDFGNSVIVKLIEEYELYILLFILKTLIEGGSFSDKGIIIDVILYLLAQMDDEKYNSYKNTVKDISGEKLDIFREIIGKVFIHKDKKYIEKICFDEVYKKNGYNIDRNKGIETFKDFIDKKEDDFKSLYLDSDYFHSMRSFYYSYNLYMYLTTQ